MTLWEMTAQLPSLTARPVPLVVPTGWGLAFRRGALVPGDDVPATGPAYAQWLQERRRRADEEMALVAEELGA